MLLKEISDALSEIDSNVYYGMAAQHPKDEPWDYIVFSRDTLKRSEHRTGYIDRINVAIVREDFVDDDIVSRVVDAMESLPGIRLDGGEFPYDYSLKPGTGMVVELLELRFTHARKDA